MTGPRRHPMVVALGALSSLVLLAAGCGGEDGSGGDGAGVQTVDAAAASEARSALLGRDGGDGAGGDGRGGRLPTTATSGPPTTAPYPSITGEILATDGVTVLVSPSGVLLEVTGRTVAGWVVTTPCGATTELAGGQPVADVQVVLDPGHGGDEPGATDVPELSEAALNLSLARRTAEVLAERSITAVLTRDGDYRIPIDRRAALADAVGPEAFVSIHHNTPASRPSDTPGTEVYVQRTSGQSLRLGSLLYEEVVAALSAFDVEWTARDDAGVLVVLNDDGEDAYGIARHPRTTSALIEMAYLGNEAEAALLVTDEYLQAASVALADGIERFLTTDDFGSGRVDQPRTFNPSGASGGAAGCVDPLLQ